MDNLTFSMPSISRSPSRAAHSPGLSARYCQFLPNSPRVKLFSTDIFLDLRIMSWSEQAGVDVYLKLSQRKSRLTPPTNQRSQLWRINIPRYHYRLTLSCTLHTHLYQWIRTQYIPRDRYGDMVLKI